MELYHLLEKINREVQHIHHVDTICDFLYPAVKEYYGWICRKMLSSRLRITVKYIRKNLFFKWIEGVSF